MTAVRINGHPENLGKWSDGELQRGMEYAVYRMQQAEGDVDHILGELVTREVTQLVLEYPTE